MLIGFFKKMKRAQLSSQEKLEIKHRLVLEMEKLPVTVRIERVSRHIFWKGRISFINIFTKIIFKICIRSIPARKTTKDNIDLTAFFSLLISGIRSEAAI